MSGKYLMAAQAGQLHGEIRTQDITVSGEYPTPLPIIKLAGRKDFVLQNGSAVDIWLGGSDVSSYNGLKVEVDGVFGTQLGRGEMYAITGGTTVSGIRIMEIA